MDHRCNTTPRIWRHKCQLTGGKFWCHASPHYTLLKKSRKDLFYLVSWALLSHVHHFSSHMHHNKRLEMSYLGLCRHVVERYHSMTWEKCSCRRRRSVCIYIQMNRYTKWDILAFMSMFHYPHDKLQQAIKNFQWKCTLAMCHDHSTIKKNRLHTLCNIEFSMT